MENNNFLFQDHGDVIKLTTSSFTTPISEKLRPAVYRIGVTDKGEVFLIWVQNQFTTPKRIYSNNQMLVDMVIASYKTRQQATAALFIGPKGGGKTMTTEIIANKLLQDNIPVFLIDRWISPDILCDIVPKLGPCCVLFDEFGKNFPPNSGPTSWHITEPSTKTQTSLLTLFSNSSLKKVLFLITENAESGINNYIRNRPERVLFAFYFPTYGVKEVSEIYERTFNTKLSKNQVIFLQIIFKMWKLLGVEYGMDAIGVIASLMKEYGNDFKKYITASAYFNIPQPSSILFAAIQITSDKNLKEPYLLEKADKTGFFLKYPNTENRIFIPKEVVEAKFIETSFKNMASTVKNSRISWNDPVTGLDLHLCFAIINNQASTNEREIFTEENYVQQNESFFVYDSDKCSAVFRSSPEGFLQKYNDDGDF